MTEEQKIALADKIANEAIAQNEQLGLGGGITLFVSVATTYGFNGNPLGFEPNSPEDIAITNMVNDRLSEYNERHRGR